MCIYVFFCIYVYAHIFHFLYPLIYCFHILSSVNNTARNIRVHVCFQISVLIFFRYISMNETDGSHDSSTFRYLTNLHTILCSCCTNLHFHQQSTLVPSFFPPLDQHSAICRLFDDSYSDGYNDISLLQNYISLIIEAEHLFMCLLATCISSQKKCLSNKQKSRITCLH